VRVASFRAYGLGVHSTFELPVGTGSALKEPACLSLRLARQAEIARAWSETNGTPAWQTMLSEDCHVRFERGHEGDHLLTFGRRARFHLDRDGGRLLCAPSVSTGLEWQRFLLDTALCCASSIRGFEALHASAVRTERGIAAFVATRGAGKSTLAAHLLGRGHELVCDDVLALSGGGGEVLGHPGPPLMTLQARTVAELDPGEALGSPTGDGSIWVRVPRGELAPERLAAIFILEPHRSLDLRPIRESARPGRLLPHTLSLDRDPARALSRLGLLRKLAASAPVYSVGVRDSEAAVLADTIEDALASEPVDRSAPARMDHASAA
jgi:hypothetical protein